MELDNYNGIQTQNEDQNLQRVRLLQTIKEKTYKFFYNIWPSVNRVITFFFYHLMRILKGFFKVAVEQFKNGG